MNKKWIILILVTAAISTGCNEKEPEANQKAIPADVSSEIQTGNHQEQAHIEESTATTENDFTDTTQAQTAMDLPGIAPENLDKELTKFVEHIASRQTAEIPVEELKEELKGVIKQIEAKNDI